MVFDGGGRTPAMDGGGGKTPMYGYEGGGGGGGKTPLYDGGGGGRTPQFGGGVGGKTPLYGGGGVGAKTPAYGGATPLMGGGGGGGGGGGAPDAASVAEDYARLQRQCAMAAGLVDCDLMGQWACQGVRVRVVKGAHAGSSGFIRAQPAPGGKLALALDDKGNHNVALGDTIPVVAEAKESAGEWAGKQVMVMTGDYRGKRATVVTYEEEEDDFFLEGGEEDGFAESIPRTMCILVQMPQKKE